MLYLDTETAGITAPLLTIQYGQEEGPIKIHLVWQEPVERTLELIEWIAQQKVCAWNLAFDWFQLVKWYNLFRWYDRTHGGGLPDPSLICEKENLGPPRDWCVKPADCLDLMIHAQTNDFQHLMKRDKPTIVRRVPYKAASTIQRMILDTFRGPPGARLHIYQGQKVSKSGYVDLIIRSIHNLSLKYVWSVCTGEPEPPKASDVFKFLSAGYNYRPWGGTWHRQVAVMGRALTPEQERYARHDITMLRDVKRYLAGDADIPSNEDHRLAVHNGAARWRGFALNVEELLMMHQELTEDVLDVPTAPADVKYYLSTSMNRLERVILKGGTSKPILREIAKWGDHPAAVKAKHVKEARHAQHLRGAIRKLLRAGSFHPAMKSSGTLTNRQAGGAIEKTSGGSLNPQGMDELIHSAFTMAYPGEVLCGGDFSSFEPSIADAVWKCPRLHELLKAGKKIHALYGVYLLQIPYETILQHPEDYKKSKIGFLSDIYGGTEYTLSKNFGLPQDVVKSRRERWRHEMPEMGSWYEQIRKDFTILDAAYRWSHPKDRITTELGFTRKFDLELAIAHALYECLGQMPKVWDGAHEFERYDKRQSLLGACRSALYGGIFGIQSRVQRVAGNCYIQSIGGVLTKRLQDALWSLQPTGVAHWQVRSINIHDELLVVCTPGLVDAVREVTEQFVEMYQQLIPLLKLEWKEYLNNWTEVKDEMA